MCFNSPYVERVALPQMKEIIEKYDIDGFFFDFVVQQYLEVGAGHARKRPGERRVFLQ